MDLPPQLQTALEALYGHYKETFELWQKEGVNVPPCFIVVCNNTATSKLVYDYISGFVIEKDDGTSALQEGRLPLFRNTDQFGNPLARPNTLLIDSEQLESGDALDSNFREMASFEIDRFRREIIERTGDRRQAVRIPTNSSTHSKGNRPLIPRQFVHLSERSDTGGFFLLEVDELVNVSGLFSH